MRRILLFFIVISSNKFVISSPIPTVAEDFVNWIFGEDHTRIGTGDPYSIMSHYKNYSYQSYSTGKNVENSSYQLYPYLKHTSYRKLHETPMQQPHQTSFYYPLLNESPKNPSQVNVKLIRDNCTCGIKKRTRIINGFDATIKDLPWLVQIFKNNINKCVGVLITRRHVLTAAHCFDSGYAGFYLRLGHRVKYTIEAVYKHEGYNKRDPIAKNDIAIILIKEHVTLGRLVQTICLPKPNIDFTAAKAIAAGWGYTQENGDYSSDLKQVKLPILSKEDCRKSNYSYKLPENTFCAGYLDGGYDTCKGDSGGPVMVRGKKEAMMVAGVVSYGRGCGRPGYPGINTNVSNFIGWILRKIRNHHLCSPP